MTSGMHDQSDQGPPARSRVGSEVQCIVLVPHGLAAPEELMSSLRARNLAVTTVTSPSTVMAELGLGEIEYRQHWDACYDEDVELSPSGAADPPPLPERSPMILLMVEPSRIESGQQLNAAVARYYPSVLRWCYDPNGNPRLGPLPSPAADSVPATEYPHPMPEIHTRPFGVPKPRPHTSSSEPAQAPPLRLHPGESKVDDPPRYPPPGVQTKGNGRHPDPEGRAVQVERVDAADCEPQVRHRHGEAHTDPDEAVTSEELAMLLSPDDPETDTNE